MKKSRMDWRGFLLSFSGRVDCFTYGKMVFLHSLIIVFGLAVLAQVHVNVDRGPTLNLVLVLAAVIVGIIIPAFVIGAKRLHDRDKSAWWLLLFYAVPDMLLGIGIYAKIASDVAARCDFAAFSGRTCPGSWTATICVVAALAIEIWTVVELGFLRGTVGPNRYGPEPLQRTEPNEFNAR